MNLLTTSLAAIVKYVPVYWQQYFCVLIHAYIKNDGVTIRKEGNIWVKYEFCFLEEYPEWKFREMYLSGKIIYLWIYRLKSLKVLFLLKDIFVLRKKSERIYRINIICKNKKEKKVWNKKVITKRKPTVTSGPLI